MHKNRIASIDSFIWKYISLLIVIVFMYSCEDKSAEPVYMGFEYFPVEQGRWVIYEVDSTVYDDFLGEVFHFKFQVKEVQDTIFISDSGEKTMRLKRFWRGNDDQKWNIKNVWSLRVSGQRGLKTEENITYAKLSFPLKKNKSWDGNAFNYRPPQPYTITDVHLQRKYGELIIDSTLRVLQKEFITLIGEELQYEIYGKGIGLVEKRFTDLQKEIDGTISSGVTYTYTIRDYGIIFATN